MLTIRQQQVEALANAASARLATETLARIRADAPHAIRGLTDEERNQRLATAIRKGHRYGFRTVRDWRAFVRLIFEIGPNFDRYPPFQNILRLPDAPPGQHLPALFQYATETEWTRAAVYDIVSRSRQDVCAETAKAESVRLEPLAPCHADSYFRLSSHPDVWRLANLTPLASIEETRRHISSLPEDGRKSYAVMDSVHGLVGAILLELSTACRLCYWIGRPFWGQGIATRAIGHLLATGQYPEMMAVTYSGNTPSRRVLEKCGFSLHGEDPAGEQTYWYCGLRSRNG